MSKLHVTNILLEDTVGISKLSVSVEYLLKEWLDQSREIAKIRHFAKPLSVDSVTCSELISNRLSKIYTE